MVDGLEVGNVAASGGLMGKIDIKARDFQGFLPKSELISWLIWYEINFSFSSHDIISTSIHDVSYSLNDTLCSD